MKKFEIPDCEFIEPHELTLVDARQRAYIRYFIVLCFVKIMNSGSCCYYTFREIVDAKSFKGISIEMTCENIIGIIVGKDPVVEHRHIIFLAEILYKQFAFVSLAEHLGRVEALEQFVDIFIISLSKIKLACRDIEESNSRLLVI